MSSVSPNTAALPPVAAAPAAPSQSTAAPGDASTLTPLTPGFTPAPAGTATAPAAAGTPAATGAAPAQQQAQGIELQQGLQLLKDQFGDDYFDPIVAADGTIYLEARKPDVVGGKLQLRFEAAAHVDKSTGKMLVNGAFLDAQKPKRDPSAKPVKVGNQYFWQTLAKDKTGKLVAQMDPISDAELQQLQDTAQADQTQQAQQAWLQDKTDWYRKLGMTASWMKIFGYGGSLVQGLSGGRNVYTGQPTASWMTGYMVLQMLDSQGGGKLLPAPMKSGIIGGALNWGTQALFMLDMGRDLHTLGNAMPRTAALMRTVTAPTRAMLHGVASLSNKVSSTTGEAAAKVNAAAAAAAGEGGAISANVPRVGLAAQQMASVGPAAQIAEQTAEMAQAYKHLGTDLNTGNLVVVGHTAANGMPTAMTDYVAVANREGGALQLVPRSALPAAEQAVTAKLTGPLKLSEGINHGINGTLQRFGPMLRTLQTGGAIAGAAMGALNIGMTVKSQGTSALWKTKDGRNAVFSFLSGSAFLGMMALPLVATLPQAPAIAASMNVASNVFGAVSMLNYDGLLGGGGWLDHDAVRAAFLIPPLTPLGLAGLWMKRREKAAKAKAKQLEANQKAAVATVTTMRTQAEQQLQSGAAPQGATKADDGAVIVQTGVSNDLSQAPSQAAGQPADASASRTLRLVSRRMA